MEMLSDQSAKWLNLCLSRQHRTSVNQLYFQHMFSEKGLTFVTVQPVTYDEFKIKY